MIILDTNVISEPLRPAAAPAVRKWLNDQNPDTLYTTSINLAELLAGVATLPPGKRRNELDLRVRATLKRIFATRVLDFDTDAAESYALIAEESKKKGLVPPHDDALIAAIARVHGFAVATRNVSNFAGTGIDLINPWKHA